MSGIMVAAMTTVGVGTAYMGNQAADTRANAANKANAASAARSRELAEKNTAARKEELLRRFNINSSKIKDSQQQINSELGVKLTNLDMAINKSLSATDNALATRHLTGRLADRLRAAQALQGDMAKGTTIQGAQAQTKDIGEKLAALATNFESEQLDLGIDLQNSINAANNAEIRGYTYSQSTGLAGIVGAGLQGAMQGAELSMAIGNYNKQIGGLINE